MTAYPRRAIIDIGSNSVRLVVYGGPARAPVQLFNEKVMAGLGRGVVATGRLHRSGAAAALRGLERWALLLDLMQPASVRVVATAAVREAEDGQRFMDRLHAMGLPAEVLDGDGEALAAGYGVISAHPGADGVVADMGGGSLELARVARAEVGARISLPLGAMRVAAIRADGHGRLRKTLRTALAPLDWLADARGKGLYLVGGSWRALARVHMHLIGWPLPVISNYGLAPESALMLKDQVAALGHEGLAAMKGVSKARIPQIEDAAALLVALTREIAPARIIFSAHGLRDGLLYQALDAATRARDPLLDGVHHALGDQQQVPGYAEAVLRWSDAIFADDPPQERRLRHVVCLIAGTAWAANPDFRALEGEDMALHGNWIAVDAADRAVMAMALHVGLGGDAGAPPALLAALADPTRLARARAWGFAVRLAHRLGAGVPQILEGTSMSKDQASGLLTLHITPGRARLINKSVERRLGRLARTLALKPRIESSL